MIGKRKRLRRKLRFFLDMLLTLILLLAVFLSAGSRAVGEEARFRRAEKAELAGPSRILDRIDVPADWPIVSYTRLLLADDGESILFYPVTGKGYGTLLRREKADGLLLAPPPGWGLLDYGNGRRVIPLFLFADDPAAVKAEVTLRLSDTAVLDLCQVRGGDAPPEERDFRTRETFFWFSIPVPESQWSKERNALMALMGTNTMHSAAADEFPAVIRLYDSSGALLETREYTVRSRAAE